MILNMKIFSLQAFLLASVNAYPGYDEGGGGLWKTPCPYASGFAEALSSELGQSHDLLVGHKDTTAADEDRRALLNGLLNKGKGCWRHCSSTAGDCPSYCGTGQCCRLRDYKLGVPGCELAHQVESGARCGAWAGDPPQGPRNVGLACSDQCDSAFGEDCAYCGGWDGVPDGSGQCCRLVDGER